MSFALSSKSEPVGKNKTLTPAKPRSARINNSTTHPPNSIVIPSRPTTIGNGEVMQTLMDANAGFDFSKIGIIQPKLKISQPGDVYEQEADRVAEEVMKMYPSQSTRLPLQNRQDSVDRKCAACEMTEQEEEQSHEDFS
jgi:hypothetical protein